MRRKRKNHGRMLTAGMLATRFVEKLVPKHQLELIRLQALWEANVPPHVLRVAWPVALRDRALVVHVVNNQWLHELVYLRSELLSCLQDAVGPASVDELRFRVGDLPDKPIMPPDAPLPKIVDLPPQPSDETLAALHEIEDPKLRQAVANARMALSGVRRS